MKYISSLLLIILILSPAYTHSRTNVKLINYLSPVPNAQYVKRQTEIIIKTGDYFDDNSARSHGVISVIGSKSGLHSGSIVLSEKNKTLIFKPENVFDFAETVFVKINSRLKTSSGDKVQPYSYYFVTCKSDIAVDPADILKKELGVNNISTDTLPSDFPAITINYSNNPSSGYIFISNFAYGSHPTTPYLIICSNTGEPYYYKRIGAQCYDFKVQPNGNLTYYNYNRGKFFELSSDYQLIDSFACGNGYSTDLHELRLLNNGHAFLMSYDEEIVDMSQIVQGGNPAASVTGLIVQELDENKNVVFQWRSWDHFQITDATHENFLSADIDYVHGNSIEIDNDGNLIISSRNMDEVTKINHVTGDIIWRLGGKNNQFTFIGDPIKFSHQHAARRIPNGNITLFDNGNFHTPSFSRAAEYNVDDVNMTAALVWEYRNNPSIYSPAMGFVQRLTNGNTIIGWGFAATAVTEVTPEGTRAFELSFGTGIMSYRAFRFDWNGPPVGLSENNNPAPGKYSLSQNYPNPFNPSTDIRFELPVLSDVNLSIYDELGREVTVLLSEKLSAGSYNYHWNASQYSSGVYFYRLKANGFVETKKMIILK